MFPGGGMITTGWLAQEYPPSSGAQPGASTHASTRRPITAKEVSGVIQMGMLGRRSLIRPGEPLRAGRGCGRTPAMKEKRPGIPRPFSSCITSAIGRAARFLSRVLDETSSRRPWRTCSDRAGQFDDAFASFAGAFDRTTRDWLWSRAIGQLIRLDRVSRGNCESADVGGGL